MDKLANETLELEILRIKELRSHLGITNDPVLRAGSSVTIAESDLLHIADNLDVTAPQNFVSHRKVSGGLIVVLKNLVLNKLLSPLLRMSLGRQWALNHHVFQTAAAVAELSERLKSIEERLANLESNRG